MPNPPIHPLVIHLSDPDWRNGVACNQPRRGRALQITSDAWAVTCRSCLDQLRLRLESARSDGLPQAEDPSGRAVIDGVGVADVATVDDPAEPSKEASHAPHGTRLIDGLDAGGTHGRMTCEEFVEAVRVALALEETADLNWDERQHAIIEAIRRAVAQCDGHIAPGEEG